MRFPVCYKEHLLDEIKYINKSPLKSNYLCELHMCRNSLNAKGLSQLYDLVQVIQTLLKRNFCDPNSLEDIYLSLKWFKYLKAAPK